MQRLQEEIALLHRELPRYISYFNDGIASIDALLGRVGRLPLREALSFDGLPESGRYYCEDAFEMLDSLTTVKAGVTAGVTALLKRARVEFVGLVESAQHVAAQPNVASSTPAHALPEFLDEASDSSSDASDVADEFADIYV